MTARSTSGTARRTEAVKAKRGINASLDEGTLKKARMLNADRGKDEGQGSSILGFVRMGEKTEAKLGQVRVEEKSKRGGADEDIMTNWSAHHAKMMEQKAAAGVRSNINGDNEEEEEEEEEVEAVGNDLPPIPDESLSTGVLPRLTTHSEHLILDTCVEIDSGIAPNHLAYLSFPS
ncbi:hypothetical protein TrRE_jg3418 [Triparma retinervis]|uniref:Uncharacterized protein n=1 Tax=Triparma retinervis TaxID=2557542 RepID=A0A9W7DU44_9STRA|nr:hypothetical protein TrRE_jg3418 [Triparma retinervis]